MGEDWLAVSNTLAGYDSGVKGEEVGALMFLL
jgi:hypothetical protein